MSITTTTKEFGPCPACGEPITATAEIKVSDLRINGAYRTVDVEVLGISVSHDCRTKPTTACDREHDDEWVEVDGDTWPDLPEGTRVRRDWVRGVFDGDRCFVHRDDLPDDPRALIARELGPAKADTFLGLLDEHGWTVTRKGER